MKYSWILALLLILSACGPAPRDNTALKGPAKWTMKKACALPSYPDEDGDPLLRANYDIKIRTCAASRGRQVAALQSYVRKIVKPNTE